MPESEIVKAKDPPVLKNQTVAFFTGKQIDVDIDKFFFGKLNPDFQNNIPFFPAFDPGFRERVIYCF